MCTFLIEACVIKLLIILIETKEVSYFYSVNKLYWITEINYKPILNAINILVPLNWQKIGY